MVVAVDNVQAADDNSAAFLAALGHEAYHARLALIVTQRTGEAIAAPVPIRELRKRSASLKLGSLAQSACEALVGALFGRAANTGRLARVLFEKSNGNPQQCMDLAQLTVKRGIVKYIGGSWVLPLDVHEHELPSRNEELTQERLASLETSARSLCEALSVHSKRVSIEQCHGLVDGLSEPEVYLALDSLVAEQILSVDEGSYAFRHQALRHAVLDQLGDERRKSLSLRAARSLLAGRDTSVQAQVEAAWHLLHAGAETEGADLMMNAAHGFLQRQGVEDVEQVVRAIETAMELYEKQGRSKYEIARLLFPLLPMAFFVDWRVTLKHGERAIDLGLQITGLGLAARLSRYLPDKLALVAGLVVAASRFAWQRLRGLDYSLTEAIGGLCGLVPAAVGTRSIVFDLPAVQRFTEKLQPLKLFGEEHVASLMFDFAKVQSLMSAGHENQAHDLLERLQRAFPKPEIQKALGAHWKAMYGGILFSLGCVLPYEFGHRALAIAQDMEQLGVRVWAMAAEEVRMLYHAFRGESEAVARHRERVELFAVQGSTTWQADIFWPILLLDSEIRCGNTLAVRTIAEQLARRSKDHPSLGVYAEIARATYLMLRGEHKRAISHYERILNTLAAQDESNGWQAFRACFGFARALNMAGEHARAKQYLGKLLERAGSEVGRIVGHYLEPQRQLALAEAGLGNHARAIEILDKLLSEHANEEQPLLMGLLHQARAEVAIGMADRAAFERHFVEMAQRYRNAENPSLIAQLERTQAAAIRAGLRPKTRALAANHAPDLAPSTEAQRAIAAVSSASNRADTALAIIMQYTQARSGCLYLVVEDRLVLAAAIGSGRPPGTLVERMQIQVLRARAQSADDEPDTVTDEDIDTVTQGEPDTITDEARTNTAPGTSVFFDPDHTHEAAAENYRTFLLRTSGGGQSTVVGGVIVECGPNVAFTIDPELLDPIASALVDRTTNGKNDEETVTLPM